MGSGFVFDGEDLAGYGLQLESYAIPEKASAIGGSHAAIYGDSLFSTVNDTILDLSLICSVTADSRAALDSNIDTIKGILDPHKGDKVITFPDRPGRRFVGRVTTITTDSVDGRWGRVFNISMTCMAHKQAISETNDALTIESNPDTLIIPSVAGNVNRIPVEIYLRNTTGGDLASTDFTVANTTTSETITINTTLADDKWLRFGSIDSNGRFTATLDISSGTGADPEAETYTQAQTGYSAGDWCRLKGGVDNTFTITGLSAGTFEWTYRGRYI
jgi:hypothetical protein